MPTHSLNDQATIYRVRFAVGLFVLLVLAPISVIGSQRALSTMMNSPGDWLPATLPVRVTYDAFARRFQGQHVLMISWQGCDLGSEEIPKAVGALQKFLTDDAAVPDEVRYLDELDRTESQWRSERRGHPSYFERISSGQAVYDLLNSPPASFSDRSVRARLAGSMVGVDGKQTILFASFTESGNRARSEAVPIVRTTLAETLGIEPTEIYLAGPPVDGVLIDAEAQASVQKYSVPSCLLGAVICFICLRSILLTIVVIAVGMIGQGMALAVVNMAGLDMNAILIVLPPLVFVLTASAGIHLCHYYLDELQKHPGIDPTAATRNAMQAGTRPCWLAAITTMIGLGSLGMVRLWPVSAFGWIAAGSVFVTLFLLLWLLPGVMQMHGRRHQRRAANRNAANQSALAERVGWNSRLRGTANRYWQSFTAATLKYPTIMVLLFAGFAAVMASGLPQLTTSVNVPRMFPPSNRIHADYRWFEEHIGPTINAEAQVVFDRAVIPDVMDQYRLVREFDEVLRKADGVGGVISARTFLPTPPPKSNRSVRATMIETSIRGQANTETGALVRSRFYATGDENEPIWRISFRFPFGPEMDYRNELTRVQAMVNPIVNRPGVSVSYTGSVPMTAGSQDVLLSDLFRSFLTAFGVVAVIMVLLLRSVSGGLLAMFPNLFPTVTLFGIMGLSRSPLDIGSVMTASVALGIAVDATIHLLSRFRTQMQLGHDRVASATEALRVCGPAMWQTTAVCAISPLVYGLSQFVPTQRFATMMLGLLSAALIGDVLLMPSILASPLGKFLAPKGSK